MHMNAEISPAMFNGVNVSHSLIQRRPTTGIATETRALGVTNVPQGMFAPPRE